ncbi:MAG TPA: YggT family protein [Gemmatimonadales bacterium]|nr:YggT family protein [Gemmatimonadales bacterium]
MSLLLALARVIVIAALAASSMIALTHWAVRERRLDPFGAWAGFVRRWGDPLLGPIERRLLRAGRNPQDAPLWLCGGAIIGGLLLLSALSWLGRFLSEMRSAFSGGAASTVGFAVNVAYTVLMAALIVRVITSWLGLSEHDRRLRPVLRLTDWLVEPIRRRVPPFGMFDISPLIAWIVLMLARALLLAIIL